MDAALPEPATSGSRWQPLVALGVAALMFAAWVALLALGYGLGTCGEDSDIFGDEYERLCGGRSSIGVIAERLLALIAVGGLVALATGGVIWLRRARWAAVGVATGLLLGLALLGLTLDA